jgi:CPA2 family monovalent cation:H+ antiporter-2
VQEAAIVYLELGGIVVLLAVLSRLALRLGLSPIPLYLLAGLALGNGGIYPVVTSEEFIEIGADLGVILLLLMLGLEYTGMELVGSMRSGAPAGLFDLVANFSPGFAAGLLLGMGPVPALFLGGVTYISSSGVAAKLMHDLGWIGNREAPMILGLLVFEDLAMAVILPVLGAIALGGTFAGALLASAVALLAVALIVTIASRQGERLSRVAFSDSDEVNLLTVFGITLVVAGAAEQLNISAAVGAFLVGIGVSGDAAHRARELLAPLRDLFAAVFFVFFGLRIDPGNLPPVLIPVLVLVVVSALTKFLTAEVVGRRRGLGLKARRRAGTALVARGEFSIVIAGLAVSAGAGPRLGAFAAAYVLIMATLGPVMALSFRRQSGDRRGAPA